jgi:hypothetical protein
MIKNPTSFWGLGSALMGHHATRVIAATGTPYNNNIADLAQCVVVLCAACCVCDVCCVLLCCAVYWCTGVLCAVCGVLCWTVLRTLN